LGQEVYSIKNNFQSVISDLTNNDIVADDIQSFSSDEEINKNYTHSGIRPAITLNDNVLHDVDLNSLDQILTQQKSYTDIIYHQTTPKNNNKGEILHGDEILDAESWEDQRSKKYYTISELRSRLSLRHHEDAHKSSEFETDSKHSDANNNAPILCQNENGADTQRSLTDSVHSHEDQVTLSDKATVSHNTECQLYQNISPCPKSDNQRDVHPHTQSLIANNAKTPTSQSEEHMEVLNSKREIQSNHQQETKTSALCPEEIKEIHTTSNQQLQSELEVNGELSCLNTPEMINKLKEELRHMEASQEFEDEEKSHVLVRQQCPDTHNNPTSTMNMEKFLELSVVMALRHLGPNEWHDISEVFSTVQTLWSDEVKKCVGHLWRLKLFSVMEQQRICQRDDHTEKWKLRTTPLHDERSTVVK